MKLHLPALLAGLCASALVTSSQTNPKRVETPVRTGVPPRNQPPPIANPILLAPAQAAPQLPPQSIRVQPRSFNMDTTLARLFAGMKSITATGEFELSVTNAAKVEVTTLPLTMHLIEGRVRTELDLTPVPVRIDSVGPFAALRAVGINRVVTLTMSAINLRLTQQLFPDAKAYITLPLPDEDIPAMIRMEKVSLGKDPVNGMEKFMATLTYTNGEKRAARLWQTTAAAPHPAQVQFDVGVSLITIRIRKVESIAEPALATALFQIPTNYFKWTDVGQMLQFHSASQLRNRR
ncbi:MAG: hypothetical protein HZA92_01495 [Verrucomicrobia bacterium]|nr:hypothetical protein [Verrucomicrobiota bacterium]